MKLQDEEELMNDLSISKNYQHEIEVGFCLTRHSDVKEILQMGIKRWRIEQNVKGVRRKRLMRKNKRKSLKMWMKGERIIKSKNVKRRRMVRDFKGSE